MTDTPKLLPCPFCGEQPRTGVYAGDLGGVYIHCPTVDCPAGTSASFGAMTDPIVTFLAWNRRHDAAVSAARKEAYRDGWRFAFMQCERTGSVPDPDYKRETTP